MRKRRRGGMIYKEFLRKVFQRTLGMYKLKVAENTERNVGSLP